MNPKGGARLENPDEQELPGGARWSEAPGLAARGMCMGTADVVPGVSGGTMALILGIYQRLVRAIESIDRRALGLLARGRLRELRDHVHWRFLGAVATGQAIGVVLFTKVFPLPRYLHEHPEPVYGLFFGLILGSILVLGRDQWRAGLTGSVGIASLLGLVAGVGVVNAVRTPTPETPLFVFLCGCVAICAMILPGISGSFVLLILRKYAYVLGALGEVIHPENGDRMTPFLNVVLPFALGCGVGLVAFSRVVGWLLARAKRATLAFMTGLMAGSLWAIWPFQERVYEEVREGRPKKLITSDPILPEALDETTALALVLVLIGLVGVVLLDHFARRRGDAPQTESVS